MRWKRRRALVNSRRQRNAAGWRTPVQQMSGALILLAIFAVACNYSTFRAQTGMPPEAQTVIDAFSKDVSENRYEKIYNEAAEEWRQRTTIEGSQEFFKTLKEKLGGVKIRTQQTVRDQRNSGGELSGHSLVVIYQTAFERAEGMETFTLVERDGRWLLAGYFVNSSALK